MHVSFSQDEGVVLAFFSQASNKYSQVLEQRDMQIKNQMKESLSQSHKRQLRIWYAIHDTTNLHSRLLKYSFVSWKRKKKLQRQRERERERSKLRPTEQPVAIKAVASVSTGKYQYKSHSKVSNQKFHSAGCMQPQPTHAPIQHWKQPINFFLPCTRHIGKTWTM